MNTINCYGGFESYTLKQQMAFKLISYHLQLYNFEGSLIFLVCIFVCIFYQSNDCQFTWLV